MENDLLSPIHIYKSTTRCENKMAMLISITFVVSYFSLVCAKPLFLEMPLLRSQVFNQHSQAEESQPQGDVFEPEESIYSHEGNITSDVNEFLEIPTAHNRTARSTHPCVSKVWRERDSCRNRWVQMVQCDRTHPACNHVIPIHSIPKCQTVYSYYHNCPSIPVDCKCAS
ncbi:hypothetical protein ACROYT_G036801 [Oculina patagonica]